MGKSRKKKKKNNLAQCRLMRDDHTRSLDIIERTTKCFEIVNLVIKRCTRFDQWFVAVKTSRSLQPCVKYLDCSSLKQRRGVHLRSAHNVVRLTSRIGSRPA